MNPQSAFDQSDLLLEKRRFRSALKGLVDAVRMSSDPAVKLICNFQMGAIHWSCLGNGTQAREFFQLAAKVTHSGQLPSENEAVKTILANSCENLMLLSLSYEEYEDWSRQLRELQPKNDILRGQVPVILNARNQGHPWSEMLQEIAYGYYNYGSYGCGASIWEVLLTNRKKLRVNREDWQNAVYEFSALAMRVVTDALMMMEKSPEGPDLDECLFVVDPAIRFAEDYLTFNPDDQRIGTLKGKLELFCREAHKDFGQEAESAKDIGNNVRIKCVLKPGSFMLNLPKTWKLVNSMCSDEGQMEFAGPDGFMRFAIGLIDPIPTVEQQQCTLRNIAQKYKHTILEVSSIDVDGKRHATMTVNVPGSCVLKNYSLIFDKVEYLATAKGDFQVCDEIIKTFRTIDTMSRKTTTTTMKTDYRVCQKCGTVYARRDVDGPDPFTGIMDIIYDHSTVCRKCGGKVVWQSSPEIESKSGRGCLPVILLIGILAALAIWF